MKFFPINSLFVVLLVLIAGACTMSSQTNNEMQASKNAPVDSTELNTLIHNLFAAVDRRDWAAAKATMADTVYIDYAELGGKSGHYAPADIIKDWKALLPGFERTVHQIHNLTVWIAGDRATATFDGTANHYLGTMTGENYWIVFAGYDTEFIKEENEWKLARIDLSLYRQDGNTSLPQQALQNVETGNIPVLSKEIQEEIEATSSDTNDLGDNEAMLESNHYSVHKAGAAMDSGVELEKVTFANKDLQLKGHLFLPPGFDRQKNYPAVVVTGSWTSVKEQMPDEYASLLAQQGFLTFTFDFQGFGESEGQPRQVEDYRLKITDIKAAIDFLSAHPNVNMEELSGLGICASSGYMAHAVAQDARIGKLVLVAPWLHNPVIAKSIYDQRPGGTAGLLEAAQKAQEDYATTGEMKYVLAASELDPLSAMYVPENAFDYYLNPAKAAGAHYDNRFAVSSWQPWLSFDGISIAESIEQPVFIVHSESGAVPQGAKDFYALLDSQKEIVWLNEYNQQQFYFEENAVQDALQKVSDYLK